MKREQGTVIVDTSWGKMCVYTGGDGVSDTIRHPPGVGNFWDGPLRLPFYDRWSSPRKLAIEIGAFCGEGAVYLASRNRHVLAVEPMHWALTEASVEANGLKNVTVLRGAAYSEACWMVPARDEDQGQEVAGLKPGELSNPSGVAFIRATKDEAESMECVQAVVLDKWVEENEEVGLIKTDAQGCDLRALVGLKKTIERCKPAILFEFEKELAALQGDAWSDYTEFFHAMGYLLEEQDKIGYAHNYVAVPL